MAQKLNTRLLQERRSALIRRETLCLSYGGNSVDLLTVTDFSLPPAEVAARKVVVLSARVHPGESNASWMMHGLLEAVTADTPDARRVSCWWSGGAVGIQETWEAASGWFDEELDAGRAAAPAALHARASARQRPLLVGSLRIDHARHHVSRNCQDRPHRETLIPRVRITLP